MMGMAEMYKLLLLQCEKTSLKLLSSRVQLPYGNNNLEVWGFNVESSV